MKPAVLLSLGLCVGLGTIGLSNVARADIYDATVICTVRGLQQGQLALRPEPNGQPFAGLDNGNVVRAYSGSIGADGKIWEYVRVLDGPNNQVTGREGYVNGNYLSCRWYDQNGNLIRED
ncbi:hypothetical protein PN462_13500 [Spirulina sp. CS-785/01]|uniref:hypothetical protein n=1 Tax=Spirulina sp. CS-785/01 TaxID=3021716 RepID=UPI0023312205|nr:hypothetical protein [Spirulina sp. CS-785/01]MDB9314121.1 hypothetical protein [Spirulina sp. CS-785/01]